MSVVAYQPSLFGEEYPKAPSTEGIKYAGSKLKLLPQILWLAHKTGAKTVFDGFAGSTRVSQAFAQAGYDVISNDQAIWSEVFGRCYLLGGPPGQYRELINHLNALPPKTGWYTEYYGGDPVADDSRDTEPQKRPWQKHNTEKLDAIREEIDRLNLDPIAKSVALTSLIMALDQVDSTMGHFSSYLRDWSPRSFKRMQLQVPMMFRSSGKHQVLRKDIFEAAKLVEADLAYFDPPLWLQQ
jgi:adenine-specific DNA-methyltransferase